MKRLFSILLLIACQSPAQDCSSNSARVNGKLIVRGDSEAALVRSRADRVVQLQNRFGAVVGQRYEFYTGRRVLQINIINGTVASICRG